MATAGLYGNGVLGQYSSTAARRVDYLTDTIKVALTTSTYVPNKDTHTFFSSVTNEVTGAGYTAGGLALTSKTLTLDTTNGYVILDAADPTWATATITARIAVVYKDTGVAATSPLMSFVDFGGNQSTTAAAFVIAWDPTGALRYTY